MWDAPRSRLEPRSPALAGGFFTTEPPGKAYNCILFYFIIFIYFFPVSDLFVQKHRRTPAPRRQQPRGSHRSFCAHTGRGRSLLRSFGGGLGTLGSWSRSCRRLGLGWSLGLGLWPAEPETLGDASTSTFPELGVSNVGKPAELAAAACWHLGLDLLGLHEGLDSLSTCTHGLGIAGLHLLQALLVVLLGKVHVPQELGAHPLKRFISL